MILFSSGSSGRRLPAGQTPDAAAVRESASCLRQERRVSPLAPALVRAVRELVRLPAILGHHPLLCLPCQLGALLALLPGGERLAGHALQDHRLLQLDGAHLLDEFGLKSPGEPVQDLGGSLPGNADLLDHLPLRQPLAAPVPHRYLPINRPLLCQLFAHHPRLASQPGSNNCASSITETLVCM
jgi:hypothetical protein